jgi:putative ABC transport system substrate-binding protein
LQELGWIDGRTIQIEYRWAAGGIERAQLYARELVHFAPEVILATASPVVAALKEETKTLPIIFVNVSDRSGNGSSRAFRIRVGTSQHLRTTDFR